MNNKLIAVTLLVVSMTSLAQSVPSDPAPGCLGLQRVGLILPNGQNSQHFVGGLGVNNNDDDCNGTGSSINYEQLNPGEYAYGSFDADLIYEYTPDMVDFSFDLSNTFNHLPVGQQVKIAELRSDFFLLADLTLRKVLNPRVILFSPGGQLKPQSQHRWQLKVRWHGLMGGPYTEESFIFAADDVVEYNYILDEQDPESPVSVISLGHNKVSVNPGDLQNDENNLNSTLFLGGLKKYHLGILDTSAPLVVGDGIIFEVNWSLNGYGVFNE